nr:hypothetical protein CFP56_21740 [Quercus suber]
MEPPAADVRVEREDLSDDNRPTGWNQITSRVESPRYAQASGAIAEEPLPHVVSFLTELGWSPELEDYHSSAGHDENMVQRLLDHGATSNVSYFMPVNKSTVCRSLADGRNAINLCTMYFSIILIVIAIMTLH